MSSHALVEQLAGQHDAHLRWLRARLRGRLAADEIEDVLQTAYARALTALSGPAARRPDFARAGQATAWLRRIALNHAYDVLRERHGRPGGDRTVRSAPASVDEIGARGLDVDVDVDVETEAVEAVQRDAHLPLIRAAIAQLDPRHRQILQLRYGQDLPAAAVMVLVGLDRRQWEGRHTRALKACGRALARLHVSGECRRTRMLLRTAPAALLEGAAGVAGDHVASCLPCAAFSSAARFAMAGLPLPVAIEAWRLDAVEVLYRPSANPAPPSASADPVAAVAATSASSGSIIVVLAALGALAFAGSIAGGETRHSPQKAASAASGAAAMVGGREGARLASHLTPRQALGRRAREMARERAAAGRRRSPRDQGTTPGSWAPATEEAARPARALPSAARTPRRSPGTGPR